MVAVRSELHPWHHRAEQLIAEGADCITAGFPCQDLSYAGKGAGLAGARSGLVWQLLRTIRLVRPRIAILENVAALLTRGMGDILGQLAEVRYDTEWHCIPASAVGAPHQRDRVWIIATDADCEWELQSQGRQRNQWRRSRDRREKNADMADAYSAGLEGRNGAELQERSNQWTARTSSPLANSAGAIVTRLGTEPRGSQGGLANGGWWDAEPDVGRVVDELPSRVDRIECLGNAVVPAIPEELGYQILEANHAPA